jgi:hypothetical protein
MNNSTTVAAQSSENFAQTPNAWITAYPACMVRRFIASEK